MNPSKRKAPTSEFAQSTCIDIVDTDADERGAPSSLMLVLEAIQSLVNAGSKPTRERIVEMTGLKPTTVDDRIKLLRNEGIISREKQSYEPTARHRAADALSMTCLPDGIIKIEKGDFVLELVPQEARTLGMMLMGRAMEATESAQLEFMRNRVALLEREKRHVLLKNDALMKRLSRADASNQQPLLFELADD